MVLYQPRTIILNARKHCDFRACSTCEHILDARDFLDERTWIVLQTFSNAGRCRLHVAGTKAERSCLNRGAPLQPFLNLWILVIIETDLRNEGAIHVRARWIIANMPNPLNEFVALAVVCMSHDLPSFLCSTKKGKSASTIFAELFSRM